MTFSTGLALSMETSGETQIPLTKSNGSYVSEHSMQRRWGSVEIERQALPREGEVAGVVPVLHPLYVLEPRAYRAD